VRAPPLLALRLAAAALLLALAGAPALMGCGGEEAPAPPAPPAPPPSDTGATAWAKWRTFYVQQKDRIPEALVNNPGEPWGDYVGSRACAPCHADEYARWRKSFHSRTFYQAVEGTIIGDFTPQTLDAPAFDHITRRDMPSPYIAEVFTEKDASGVTRFFMRMRERTVAEGWPRGRGRDTYAGGAHELPPVGEGTTQEILYAFGNRRHQPYIVRWSAPGDRRWDGKHLVLPFYWNDAEKKWLYDGFRPYVESCAHCHVTGIKRSPEGGEGRPRLMHTTGEPLFSLPPKEEGWSEGAVGCEVCHGPGATHIRAVDNVGVERYRALRKSGAKPPSIFPSTKGSDTKEHLTQQCDACHNFFTESTVTWVPGPLGYRRDALYVPLRAHEDRHHVQHYPDGSKKSPCSIGHVYRESKMWHADVHCFDCHDPHGSDHFGSLKASVHDNSLCISCHVDLAEPTAQTLHSRHRGDSPGNRCVECHMPRHMIFTNGQQMMSERIHNHILSVPKGGAGPGSPPTSCNVCHVDRDEAWSAAEIERGWEEERGRRAAKREEEEAEARKSGGK
jgi:predicted CXXCH cytochrome family protein